MLLLAHCLQGSPESVNLLTWRGPQWDQSTHLVSSWWLGKYYAPTTRQVRQQVSDTIAYAALTGFKLNVCQDLIYPMYLLQCLLYLTVCYSCHLVLTNPAARPAI